MRSVRAGQAGFTILEVLVATLVLSLLILSTAALMLATITQAAVSARAADAGTLAQRELEQVRDMSYALIPAGTVTATRTMGGHSYTVTRVITNNDPQVNMKRVVVTVAWTIRGARSYVAETIYTDLEQ